MNNRKAKVLRKLVFGCATSYNKTNEGTVMEQLVPGSLATPKVVTKYTAVLNPVCKRKAYKDIKKRAYILGDISLRDLTKALKGEA
jgi:hypothetical protein